MYKHILIPTDGSELSEKGVKSGLAFARSIKARVTGFTVRPEYQIPSDMDVMSHKVMSPAEHERREKTKADAMMRKFAARAHAAKVKCETDFTLSNFPYDAIIRAAKKHGCDLIFMASHGRRGLSAFLHGSQTQGVLTNSTIPTLVYR